MLLDTKPEMENGNSQTISDEQALTCAVEFLISGYGTTASVLSYVSYMLALHAEIQQRVQAEIDKCFKKKPVSGYVIVSHVNVCTPPHRTHKEEYM